MASWSASVSIFIPAFNAAATLPSVIERIPENLWQDIPGVWIVNDGSTDHTSGVIEILSRKHSQIAEVLLAHNRGYGTAARIGLRKCLESGCSHAICLHADGQYPPESIPEIVRSLDANGWALAQGSRIASGTALSGGMPLYKYTAGKVLTFFENKVFGLSMTDFHSGFLCYGRRALELLPFHRLSDSFDFDLEVIASARAMGLTIGEIPIPTRYAGEVSYLNPLIYGFQAVRVMLKFALGMYRWSGR
jgi:glycosyltransferase involved in cell wall biosynthesis